MYIIVNNHPIDVYKITKVSGISWQGPSSYEAALRIYAKAINVDTSLPTEVYYHYLAENYLATKESDYRYYHTFLKRLDDVSMAVSSVGIIKKKATTAWAAMYQNDPHLPRFLTSDEINWKILPDSYFFDLGYDSEIFKGAYSHGNYLYSKFYDTEEEAEKARDLLLETINTARIQALKIEI